MRRKTFDAILTAGGLVLAVILLVAGGLLTWGSTFVSDQVRTELAAQKIVIPPAGSAALADPSIKPYLTRYGGQTVTTGDQAKAYADHFIAVHVAKLSGGQTYAELGTAQSTLKGQIDTAKAANDPSVAGLDEQLGGNVPFFRQLRVFKGLIWVLEIGARILAVSVEEQIIEASI